MIHIFNVFFRGLYFEHPQDVIILRYLDNGTSYNELKIEYEFILIYVVLLEIHFVFLDE